MKPNIQKANRWSLYATIVKTIQYPYRKVKLKATRKEEILDEQANKEEFWKYRGSRKCIRIQTSITPDGR